MSEDNFTLDTLDAMLNVERDRWVEAPASYFMSLQTCVDGLLSDGLLSGLLPAARLISDLLIAPNVGTAGSVAWAKCSPLPIS